MSDGLEYDGEVAAEGGAAPVPPAPPPSDRTRVRRLPKRGRYDRASLDAVLDAGVIAHVGWTGEDGQPYATPTIAWRVGDRLYWHGSSASRMLRQSQGIPVCVTVTLLDGYVMARSGFNHSVNFRSAMVLGTAHLVTDPAEVDTTLEAFIEGLYPGRWAQLRPMTPSERKATTVLWMDLNEASAKVRAEENHDDEGDETWPAWGGVIPLRIVADEPQPDPHVPVDIAPPAFRLPGTRRQAARKDEAARALGGADLRPAVARRHDRESPREAARVRLAHGALPRPPTGPLPARRTRRSSSPRPTGTRPARPPREPRA